MKDIFDLALRLRERRTNDEERALERVDGEERRREAEGDAVLDRAGREMRGLQARRQPAVCLGASLSSRGDPFRVLLASRDAWAGGHWAITGATGSGKSFLALALLLQRLGRERGGAIVIDMKGEFSEILRKVILPCFIANVGRSDAEGTMRFVSKIAILAPFDPNAVPPFQVLSRDQALSVQEQAHEVASSFGRTIGRDLGVLQETILRYGLQLAIDARLTLPEVAKLLMDDVLRRGALERCSLPDVRHYFATRFPRERAGSLGALLSRLDSLTMYPGLRRMLSARGMVRLGALMEDAITIIDLGGAPAGMREVPQFLGQLLFQKLVRAIFARRLRPDGSTPPVTIIADEFQEFLGPEVARDFERVLALARSQKCFLWMLFQQAAQVEATSPTLLRLLRTNTNFQAIFRANLEDARTFAHVLPTTGRQTREDPGFPDPRQPERFLTNEEERRALVELVPRMPDRLYWFWNRRAAYPSLLVRSPHLDIPGMRRRAEGLPRQLRDVIERGVVALEPEETPADAGPPRVSQQSGEELQPTETRSPRPADTEDVGSDPGAERRDGTEASAPAPGKGGARPPVPPGAGAGRGRRLSLG